MQHGEHFDLIVVGGGPGGSTLSSFVAQDGHRVLLLERERFPRHQIGESLLPSTVHGICPMLGLTDALANANFVKKRGGTFRWGRNPEPWTFSFTSTKTLSIDTSYAYQVERARFDKLLLDNARRLGVDVREAHTVTGLVVDGERVAGVRFSDADGAAHEARARFVVDAGGNQSKLGEHVGERIYSKFFRNVALYGYFEHGKRLPPPNNGNILSAAFPGGWFWYIPLSDTLTSVGAVVGREEADRLRGGYEQALSAFIEACPIIREYLSGATRVTEGLYGPLRVRRDYSYCHTRFWTPGAVLIGDAACFVDPVFSSGVHLATYSALQAARAINTSLAGDMSETTAFDEFERRYRLEFSAFYQFLVAFYDMNQDQDSYFWSARKLLNTEERANEAFVRLVAGMASANVEHSESVGASFFDARAGLGQLLQRTTEGDLNPGAGMSTETQSFLKTLRAGVLELMTDAAGPHAVAARPRFDGGLIPSASGRRWAMPSA